MAKLFRTITDGRLTTMSFTGDIRLGTSNAKRGKEPFVSHSSSAQMRAYQQYASNFPPLTPDEMNETSRIFIQGRNAKVRLEEEKMVDNVVGGDWSDESLLSKKKDILYIFDTFLDTWTPKINTAKTLPSETMVPKDEWEKMSKDRAAMGRNFLVSMHSLHHTDQERIELMKRTERGLKALEKMVNHNLQLAMSRVGKICRRNSRARMIGFNEMLSVANIGLILAVRQFDPDKGYRFSTYAPYHIDGQMLDYLQVEDGNTGIKSTTGHEQKQLIDISQVVSVYKQRYGAEPTVKEIQSITGIAEDIVRQRLGTNRVITQSIYAKSNSDDGEGEVFVPDMIMTENGVENTYAESEADEKLSSLRDMLSTLNADEHRIVCQYTGMEPTIYGERKELPQIAKELGISLKECRRIFEKALTKLRAECEFSKIDFLGILETLDNRK